MADDKSKKPKIDLKARLGKSGGAAGAGGSAVPMPVPGSSVTPIPGSAPPPPVGGSQPAPPSTRPMGIAPPVGIAPPAGMSPGIPLPVFGPRPAASAPAPKASAAQQTIKVEIGEEIHAERAKASKKTAIYAVLATIVGVGIGFVVGGAKERSDRSQAAALGAGALEKEVKEANKKLEELDEKLKAAAGLLGSSTYPVDLAKDLAALNIPFDPTHFEGKGVGNLNAKTSRALFSYATACQDVNASKDKLKNLLGVAQAPIEKSWKEAKDPVANFSVIFRQDNKGYLAELVPNKEPFLFSKDWPESYEVMKTERQGNERKQVAKKANRFKKGDLASGSDPNAIPVEAASAAALTTEAAVGRLSAAMIDLRQTLEGRQDDPTNPTPGVMKEGEDLANELHKIAVAK